MVLLGTRSLLTGLRPRPLILGMCSLLGLGSLVLSRFGL
nr:MAG TPA: hypothetical protein [Caudoviricetes sp.]